MAFGLYPKATDSHVISQTLTNADQEGQKNVSSIFSDDPKYHGQLILVLTANEVSHTSWTGRFTNKS